MRLDVGAHRLHVEVTGRVDPDPTVLFLHGLAGTGDDWHPLLESFLSPWRRVTLDLPGHGRSDVPRDARRYHFPSVTDALAQTATHLGTARPLWVGYSLGARLLLHLVLRHPHCVGALILVSPHPGISGASERTARADQDESDARLLETEGLDAFFQRWHARPVFATRRAHAEAWGEETERKRVTNHPLGLAHSLRGLGLGAQTDLLPELARVSIPVLLVVGEQDAPYVEQAHRIQATLPDVSLAVIPGAGHGPHLESPDACRAAIDPFLHSVLLPSPTLRGE